MKSTLAFWGGVLVGIAATVLVIFYISSKGEIGDDGIPGLTIFNEPGECITKDEIKIFQVLKPDMALGSTGALFDGIVVLLTNHENQAYYDDQKIKIPKDKCAKQMGIYQYTTKKDFQKTVPVVIIEWLLGEK